MTNSEARKRAQEAAEAAENSISRPASPQPTNSTSDALAGAQGVEAIRVRLRRAVAVATEGPWFNSCGGLYVYGATPGDEVARFKRRTDSDFALAARELVPPMLAVFEAMTAERDSLLATLASVRELADEWETPVEGRHEYATLAFQCAADELRALLAPAPASETASAWVDPLAIECGWMGCGRAQCTEVCTPDSAPEAEKEDELLKDNADLARQLTEACARRADAYDEGYDKAMQDAHYVFNQRGYIERRGDDNGNPYRTTPAPTPPTTVQAEGCELPGIETCLSHGVGRDRACDHCRAIGWPEPTVQADRDAELTNSTTTRENDNANRAAEPGRIMGSGSADPDAGLEGKYGGAPASSGGVPAAGEPVGVVGRARDGIMTTLRHTLARKGRYGGTGDHHFTVDYGNGFIVQHYLSDREWREIGSPDQITITVKASDG